MGGLEGVGDLDPDVDNLIYVEASAPPSFSRMR
jgi:hypothetical protein